MEKNIVLKDGTKEFQVRFSKDEGVGLLTTEKGDSYYILDSGEYWYEIDRRPSSVIKCSCKHNFFNVVFNYIKKENYDDFDFINVKLTCSKCGKEKKKYTIDTRHTSSIELLDNPITYAKNPFLKYKVNNFSGFWNYEMTIKFSQFMCNDLGVVPYFSYYDKKETKKFQLKKLNINELKDAFTWMNEENIFNRKTAHQILYFATPSCEVENLIETDNEKGIKLKGNSWKKENLIKLKNLSFYPGVGKRCESFIINNSIEYIENDIIYKKDKEFREIIKKMEKWLEENSVKFRGKGCYDIEGLDYSYMKK